MPAPDAAKSKAQVEAELEGSSDAIEGRLHAIRDEITTTGDAVRRWLRAHPLASVGGSLVAGALVGWLLAGIGGRRLSRAHRAILQRYIEALRDEVRDAVAEGEEVGAAVQAALRNRAPLVVYAEERDSGSWLGQTAGALFDTALTLILREVVAGALDGVLGDGASFDDDAPDAAADIPNGGPPAEG